MKSKNTADVQGSAFAFIQLQGNSILAAAADTYTAADAFVPLYNRF